MSTIELAECMSDELRQTTLTKRTKKECTRKARAVKNLLKSMDYNQTAPFNEDDIAVVWDDAAGWCVVHVGEDYGSEYGGVTGHLVLPIGPNRAYDNEPAEDTYSKMPLEFQVMAVTSYVMKCRGWRSWDQLGYYTQKENRHRKDTGVSIDGARWLHESRVRRSNL